MTGPQLCVGAVAVEADSLLLVRRGRPPEKGSWAVPGGRVEAGETLAEAVVREMSEETGLRAVCDHLVGWVERISARRHLVILDFSVTVLDSGEPVAGDDAAEVAWVPLARVAELPLASGLGSFLTEHRILAPAGDMGRVWPEPPP